MWKRLSDPKLVRASNSLVKRFVEMKPAPGDRTLSESRLKEYRVILKEGKFRPVVWAEAVCEETNERYRINGKHTSTMLSEQESLPVFFVLHEEYWCETRQDVAELYATFDHRLGMRNMTNLNQSFAAALEGLDGHPIPSANLNLIVAGLALREQHDSKKNNRLSLEERARLLAGQETFVLWANSILTQGGTGTLDRANQRKLHRAPVVAVMSMTYSKDSAAADTFWRSVLLESEPDTQAPSRVLGRWLVNVGISGGGKGGQDRELVSYREMMVRSMHGWNAFRNQKKTDLRYYSSAPLPPLA